MKEIKSNSIDAIVTDPPYGLEFMGKEWDRLSDDAVSKSWNTKGRTMTAKPKRQPDSPGGRHSAKISPRPNPRCRKCGRVINGADTKKGFVVCHCGQPEIYMPNTYAIKMQLWHTQWLTEAYRVLKPGGSMLVMGGTRTFHRLMCAIEDSGFIIKDTILWLYGSGFPKAQDLGKMIDKRAGKKREKKKYPITPKSTAGKGSSNELDERPWLTKAREQGFNETDGEIPISEEAKHWDGFKVGGIKPAYEPIIWAVKPPEGSYVDNVLKHGVGAVNVDETRISLEGQNKISGGCRGTKSKRVGYAIENPTKEDNTKGRFPANIILDEEAAEMLDEQSGISKSTGGKGIASSGNGSNLYSGYRTRESLSLGGLGDSGGASRFFYCAKASNAERNLGLYELDEKLYGQSGRANQALKEGKDEYLQEGHIGLNRIKRVKNNHPTVKPISLFEWLIKLVTREEQIVLDPFIGSGTTAISAHNTDRQYIGIEKEKEYIEIAEKRLEFWKSQMRQMQLDLF